MTFILLAVCLLVIAVLYLKTKKSSNLAFPGPKGLPFFGSFFEIKGRQMSDVLLDWKGRFGSVFTFSLFEKQFLVVGSPEALQEVLVSRGKAYGGRPRTYRTGVMTNDFQGIILNDNLVLHKVLRGATQNVLNAYGRGRGRLEVILDAAVDDIIDQFQKKGGESFDPWEEIYGATSLTVFMMLSGQKPEDPAAVTKAMREYCQIFTEAAGFSLGNIMLDRMPFMRHLPWFPPYKKLMNLKKRQIDICDEIIGPVMEMCTSSEHPTLGKALLDIVGDAYGQESKLVGFDKPGHISMTNVKEVCFDMIVGGNVTTSTSFYGLLNILQSKPDIQQCIADEIRAVVGDDSRVTLDHKDSLPYTRATIFELLMYSSIVPLGIPHIALEDTELCGSHVPAGTYVITQLGSCHHDPKLWEDPWEFQPARFLDDDGQLLPPDHTNRKQLFPFGAGTRVCAGELLALNRLFLFVTNIIQNFQLVPPDGVSTVSCDPRDYKMGAIATPPNFEVCAFPRGRK